jgi:3-hydroxyacyl-CoA dehydrogenase/enoyl-CoA hydratase/3-hydroxybutyryl-CoA epimerase
MSGLQRYERHEVPGASGPVVSLHLMQEGRPVVVLDRALLESIDATLDRIADEFGADLAGFVLASDAPKAFIAGANLKEIMELDDPGLHDYLEFGSRVYQKIADLPCRTVAAIDGACLGGGLEIAMHCDTLIAARPAEGARAYPVGLPEAGLNICPGWGGTNMLPARFFDGQLAMELTATGKPLPVTDHLPGGGPDKSGTGLISEAVEADDLLSRAIAGSLDPKPGPVGEVVSIARGSGREKDADGWSTNDEHRLDLERVVSEGRIEIDAAAEAVLECVRVGLDEGWEAALRCEREHLVRLRHTEEGRGAIEAFFAKTAAR